MAICGTALVIHKTSGWNCKELSWDCQISDIAFFLIAIETMFLIIFLLLFVKNLNNWLEENKFLS